MIIRKDKTYETNLFFPNTDWYNKGNYIMDETTEEGQLMAQIYIENYPFVDIEHDGEFVTRVIILDKPIRLPEVEGKRIELVKNDLGEWEYVYVDIPITKEELKIKELEQQLLEVQEYMLEAELEKLMKEGGM